MKKNLLILLTTIILLPLVSCTKDDRGNENEIGNNNGNGNSSNYSTLIIGKWKFEKHVWCGEDIGGNYSIMETVEFRSNKICIVNGRGDFPYTISGNELSINYTYAGVTLYYTIVSVSNDKIVFEYPDWMYCDEAYMHYKRN